VRAVQGDAAGLLDAVPSDAADAVLCHGALEHVDDPALALAACRSALQPGGGLLSLLVAQRAAAVLARAVAGHLDQARHALVDPDGRWGVADPLPRRFDEPGVVALLGASGLEVGSIDGVRVVTDLVPEALIDGEPGAVEELLALERATAADPTFRAVATQLHVLAVRS
jgi:SAM-dependent methyltransferase